MKKTRDRLHRLINLAWDIEFCELRLTYANKRLQIVIGSEYEFNERKEVQKFKADLQDFKAQFNRIKKVL